MSAPVTELLDETIRPFAVEANKIRQR